MTTERSGRAYAAVDLGASSGRVMLGVVDGETLRVTEVHRFGNGPVEHDGVLVWDADRLFEETLNGLAAARAAAEAQGSTLLGIGVDSWGVDYGLLDREGRFTHRVKHHRGADPAGPARAEALVPAERAYELTGVLPQSINTAYQLRTDVADGTARGGETVLLVPDLWVHLLTGAVGAELTSASTTQLLGLRDLAWSEELVREWGLAGLVLPAPVAPGTPAGLTTPAITERLGATDAVPVYRVAGHDTASALAFAAPDSGELLISSGSWSLTGLCLSRPVLTGAALREGYTNEFGVGGATLFVRNLAGMWLLLECTRVWSERDGIGYDPVVLIREVLDEPAEPAPIFDVGDARLLAPGDMPSRIAELCRERGQAAPEGIAATVRSIIESLAAAFADAASSASALTGIPVRSIRIVGGGSRNELLCRRTAERTGLPVIAGPGEASALGNLAVQLVAAGELPDIAAVYAAADRAAPETRRYEPPRGPVAETTPKGNPRA